MDITYTIFIYLFCIYVWCEYVPQHLSGSQKRTFRIEFSSSTPGSWASNLTALGPAPCPAEPFGQIAVSMKRGHTLEWHSHHDPKQMQSRGRWPWPAAQLWQWWHQFFPSHIWSQISQVFWHLSHSKGEYLSFPCMVRMYQMMTVWEGKHFTSVMNDLPSGITPPIVTEFSSVV